MSDTTDAVMDFIIAYKKAHDGNSPSIREIMVGCDISSTSTVSYHLNKLAKKGRITRSRANRSIEVKGGAWICGRTF